MKQNNECLIDNSTIVEPSTVGPDKNPIPAESTQMINQRQFCRRAQFESFTGPRRQWIGSGACHRARQDAEPERTGMYLQRVAGATADPRPITKPLHKRFESKNQNLPNITLISRFGMKSVALGV